MKLLDSIGLNYFLGKIKAWALATFASNGHSQASNTINAMTGYSKPSSGSAIAASDSLNSAIGKLEAKVDAVTVSDTPNLSRTISGSGNAITDITVSGHAITATKDITFADDINVVHKTGTELVQGDKTFTGYITLDKSAPGLALKNTNISKGTKPSVTNYYNISWTDTNGISVENRLGLVETSVDTDGNTNVYFRAYKNASGSSANVSMGVCYNYDASSGFTFAPTPATNDNSTKIATTAFVKAQGYLTSHQTLPTLSLTTSGSGNAITALSVSEHAITATKGSTFLTSHQSLSHLVPQAAAALPTGNLTQNGLQLVEVYNNNYPISYGNVINVQGSAHKGAGQLLLGWSGSDNGIANIYYRNKRDAITTWSDWKQIAFTDSAITGNAGSATKLATARSINGTNFDGSANITTANWGTARNIYVSDSDGTNTGAAVSVNGSANATLKLPATIKASITGNCSGSSGSCTGNAATATKINTTPAGTTYVNAVKSANALVSATTTGFGAIWNAPTKNYRVGCATYPSSNDQILWYSVTNANVTAGTNTVAKSMNWDAGTGILTATGFSGPLTGNASTATKLATARSINIQDSSATNTGTAASFDGSANATIKLPATIKANITGNASGSSGSCTGNAATATQLKTARTLWGQSFNGTANVTGTIKTDEVRAGSNSDEIAIYGSTSDITGSCAKFHGISATTYDPGGTARKGSIEIMAGTASTYKCIDFTAGSAWFECSILPNGTQALGHKDYRWNSIYLNNSPNVSSDRRIKSFIGSIPDNVLDTWENIEWKQFKLNDAIEEKGEDAARFHTGLIVQDIKEAFEADELDPSKYGLYCYDTHEERKERIDENGRVICTYRPAGNQYSLRYTEALCMEAAYQRRKNKILENRISELEMLVKDIIANNQKSV